MTVDDINRDIYAKGSLNREHVKAFLEIPENNSKGGDDMRARVKAWLESLNKDETFSKITFPNEGSQAQGLGVSGDGIQRVLDDLENYGHVTPSTVLNVPED